MKKHLAFFFLAFAFLVFTFLAPQGCTYESGDLTPEVPIDTTVVVSLSQDIIPLFEQNCNNATCHGAGGISPILEAGSAYSELINGGFIDTDTPENSELYQWMIGNRRLDMPLSGPKPELNALVLTWIIQGAQDN